MSVREPQTDPPDAGFAVVAADVTAGEEAVVVVVLAVAVTTCSFRFGTTTFFTREYVFFDVVFSSSSTFVGAAFVEERFDLEVDLLTVPLVLAASPPPPPPPRGSDHAFVLTGAFIKAFGFGASVLVSRDTALDDTRALA